MVLALPLDEPLVRVLDPQREDAVHQVRVPGDDRAADSLGALLGRRLQRGGQRFGVLFSRGRLVAVAAPVHDQGDGAVRTQISCGHDHDFVGVGVAGHYALAVFVEALLCAEDCDGVPVFGVAENAVLDFDDGRTTGDCIILGFVLIIDDVR